jgi:peptide/nickel transport system permease protein
MAADRKMESLVVHEPAQEQNRLWRLYKRSPLALLATALLVLLVLAGIFAPTLAPHDPMLQTLPARLKPPIGFEGYKSGYYFGTDRIGRDVLSNMIYGIRVSLQVAAGAISISVLIGVPLGLLAGYYRGWVDAIVMRAVDIQLALPTILVAMGVLAVWGRGLDKIVLVVGIVGWAIYARTARASVLQIREKEFVESSMALGAKDSKIILRHILPNILTPLVILISVEVPRVVLYEATLSFLGMGVPANVPSLGVMINEGYQVLFSGRWWVSVLPGGLLMLLVLSVNMFGDWLRDAMDPRLRH